MEVGGMYGCRAPNLNNEKVHERKKKKENGMFASSEFSLQNLEKLLKSSFWQLFLPPHEYVFGYSSRRGLKKLWKTSQGQQQMTTQKGL
jgi:hypothetical protein